jgi:ribonuclease III family protein
MTLSAPLPHKPHMYNGLTLAYMGDAVYETYVRRHLLAKGEMKAQRLHNAATGYVSAKAQARALQALLHENRLNEAEYDIVKRGRNAQGGTVPKHTDWQVYRMSTALESLIGYLFLDKQTERLEEIMGECFTILERKEERT